MATNTIPTKTKTALKTVADSLRQYRRADLTGFASDGVSDPLDEFYTDPLPDEAVLSTVLSSNTTFVIGRKGTGKSTIFAKAQKEIRKKGRHISIYIDVKSLYETAMQSAETVAGLSTPQGLNAAALEAHLLRKAFISRILKELIGEVRSAADSMNVWAKIIGMQSRYNELVANLREVEADLQDSGLRNHELPVLQTISAHEKQRDEASTTFTSGAKGSIQVSRQPSMSVSDEVSQTDKALIDEEVFEQYSKAMLRSFPFSDLIDVISNLLSAAKLDRLFIFFDDFSELRWIDQRLFVDVVLAHLNNASNEKIKLKVACYPGRIYYGKIDPGKIDEVHLDFFDLYKSDKLPDIEAAAVDYTKRLMERRFDYYKASIQDLLSPQFSLEQFYQMLFQVTFNVPRVLGYVLHFCYMDSVSRGQQLTPRSLRNAAEKYYSEKMASYFKLNKFALEPYERKLDRFNQESLLRAIVDHSKSIKRDIVTGKISSELLKGVSNPPTSHFAISSDLESVLAPLELNLFVSKYNEMRDKDGRDVSIFALFYGLCVREEIEWGYPQRQRYDKDYFKQRVFNFNPTLHQFLSKTKTIRCDHCGASHPIDDKPALIKYKWRCPECSVGTCREINLDDDFQKELSQLNKDIMLEPVEYQILDALHDEDKPLRAGEISTLLDVTYQLVGRRTSKLQDMGYVDKQDRMSRITELAQSIYFEENGLSNQEEQD